MSDSPLLELVGAEVVLGGERVLGPIDLQLARGEHLLVVGPSGCGKTTLLRAVAGLQRLEAGLVRIDGAPASEGRRLRIPPERRKVALVFQGGALWPHMSVRKTLDFVLRARGTAADRRSERIAELVALVELTGLEKRKPGELSGGEAQRLALARALALDPEILLLDEPLGPLDAELRTAMIERIGDLGERLHLTVLHVTHDPHEVERVATRTLRMRGGLAVLEAS
jgi:ABC-type Fe3+/spermidine/putrescine transport system ATPase subunit